MHQSREPRIEGTLGRGQEIRILVDGRAVRAHEGETVAAALLADGRRALRHTALLGEPRGLYCGIGLCFDCVMTIDRRPNVRACQTPVRSDMVVESQAGDGVWADWETGRPSQSEGAQASRAGTATATATVPSGGAASVRPLVIVGGGPAGLAAAIEAARAGVACTVVDENPRVGGQIYRQPPTEFALRDTRHLGSDFRRGQRLRQELGEVQARVELLSDTSVLGIWPDRELLCASDRASFRLRAERLVLAAGAYDRPVPFPGWTLPGVMTAGGAQVLQKTMAVRPGSRALVAGTGPLLLVVANQLHQAGVHVVAVLEAGRRPRAMEALPRMLGEWGLMKDAWSYWRGLRRARIPVLFNHTIFAAQGTEHVTSASFGPVQPDDWRPLKEQARHAEVDLIVVGFGFVPNTELTELAGCRQVYRHDLGGWVPLRSELFETTASGVLAVGDGAGVAGSLVAIEEGRVAGITAAEQLGALSPREAARRRTAPLRRLRSLARVRRLLDELGAIRSGLGELATPDTLMCRCEEVTRADVEDAVRQGARDLQAVKLFTRTGMGACQGRQCAPSVGTLVSARLACSAEAVGRINPRPPIKPVTLGALAHEPSAPAAGVQP